MNIERDKRVILERVGEAADLRSLIAALEMTINAHQKRLTKVEPVEWLPAAFNGDLVIAHSDSWAGTFTVVFRALVTDALESDDEELHFTLYTVNDGDRSGREPYLTHSGWAEPGALSGDTFTFHDGYTVAVEDIVGVCI